MSKTVVFIYRPKFRNEHSIENVFDTIADGFEERGYKIIKYYLGASILKSIFELRAMKVDHYHITGECYYISLFLPRSKTTLTLHDIAFYKKVKMTPKVLIKAIIWLFMPLNYLKKFNVISEIVKKETIENVYINSHKILTIPNPLSIKVERNLKKIDKSNINILQIGTGEHKNLKGLIESVKNNKNISLTIVGDPDKELINLMDQYQIKYTLNFRISQEKLLELYKMCDIVYFASLHEGFGLPILEAQAIGRPVITSNILPMSDVAGNGAFLVNPYRYDQIESAITQISKFDSEVMSVIESGYKNINRFNLDLIVDKYEELFNLKISL